jgi:parallel beta-helix repeat protein
MKIHNPFVLFILMISILLSYPQPTHAAVSMELYGTFHSAGVTVTISSTDDPNQDTVANVEYRISGTEIYRQGFPLSRVSNTRFVGSIFDLFPGTNYDVRVTFSDPDGTFTGSINNAITTRAEITIPAPNHSYYVSPAGSGTTCSLAAPCSLTEGLNQATAGAEVVLRGGIYYQGGIWFPHSGTTNTPIVIRNYNGETAILDGADPATFTWTSQGGGVWRTTVNVADTHLVTANGTRLYPYQSLADLQTLKWGIPGFYVNGTTVYVRLSGDANPNSAQMRVSRWNYMFWVNQDFIFILNLTFRHYGQGEDPRVIKLENADNNLVQGSTFAGNDLGVLIWGDARNNVVQNNMFYDTTYGWSWDAIKDGARLEHGGVRIWSGDDPTIIPRGSVVRRNTFHDSFDGFGVCPEEDTTPMPPLTNETDVYDNLVYRTGDDGIETDGVCSNVRIWGNTFRNVFSGVSLAPVRGGPIYVIRNLIAGTIYTPFKFVYNPIPSGPMFLFHNTSDGGININEDAIWPLVTFRNNILLSDNTTVNNKVDDPLDFDYDVVFSRLGKDLFDWNGVAYYSLEALCSAHGQECHGLNVLPTFINVTNGDYSLTAGSPPIDKGIFIPGINDRYFGVAPDIGAFEYEIDGFRLDAFPAFHKVDPGETGVYVLEIWPTGDFSSDLDLTIGSTSPDITVQLSSTTVTPPGYAILQVTDHHSGSNPVPGYLYSIPISVSGGGETKQVTFHLLVGGTQTYLPMIIKNTN